MPDFVEGELAELGSSSYPRGRVLVDGERQGGVVYTAGVAAGAVKLPTAIGGGATIWLRGAGITQASGAIAAWDSEGLDTRRFSAPSAATRPLAAMQGSLSLGQFDGASTDPDRVAAETALSLVRPYTVGLVLAMGAWPAVSRTILAFDNPLTTHLVALGGTPNVFRWTDGTVQISTTTGVATGQYVSLILRSNTNPSPGANGNSYLWLNGVQEATGVVAARNHAAAAWTFGARVDGTIPSALRLVDATIWNGVYLDDDGVASLNRWHTYLKGRL